MSTVNDTDLLLVERNGVQYQITYDQMSTLNDDDLLLVERGGVQYKVEAQDISTGANGLIIPPVEVLTPVNGAGITEFDQYEPVSSAITAVGEAGTITRNTDNISSVADDSAWDESKAWSRYVTGNVRPDSNGYAPSKAFNGVLGGEGIANAVSFPLGGGNLTQTWTAPTDFGSNPTLRIYTWLSQGAGVLKVNGSDVSNVSSDGWTSVAVSSLQTIEWGYKDGGSSAYGVAAIEVNGKVLVDAVEDSQVWSSFGTGSYYGSRDWSKAFDGVISTSADGHTFPNASQTMTWTPSSPITVNESVVLYGINDTDNSTYGIKLNGGSNFVLPANSGVYGVPVTIPANDIGGSLSSISLTCNASHYGPYLTGVEVDGKRLIDAGLAPVAPAGAGKILSFPTNTNFSGLSVGDVVQYATWNSAESSNKTLSNGNLDASSTGAGIVKSTKTVSSGKWYWEVTSTNGYTSIGIAEDSLDPSSITWLGQGASYSYYSYNGNKATNGSQSAYGNSYTSGDVIGVALDLDAGTLKFYKNGADQGIAQSGLTGSYTPAFGNEQVGTSVSANFGQTDFVHTPPTGYSVLGTTITAIDAAATPPSVTVDGGDWDSSNQSQTWSTGLTTPSNSFNGGQPAPSAFDGDLATFAGAGSIGEDIVFQPTTPVSYSDLIEVYTAQAGQMILNASHSVATTDATGWVTLVSGSSGSINTITIDPNSNRRATLHAIRVDGKLLVDAGVSGLGDRYLGSSISYEKSLTFTDTTELANMVGPLEMTDANGDVVTPVSDTIANVSNNVLTLQGNTNLDYFQPGDEVQTGVQVVSVDAAAPSITVDGGSWLGADGSGSTYEISKSLRFDSSASSHLSRTFSSAGNRKTWTWSAWVKRTKLETQEMIFQANNSGSLTSFYFNSADQAHFLVGGGGIIFETSRVFRDPSWMHLVLAVDTTQSTEFDRIKFYVDGEKLASDQYTNRTSFPSLNTEYEFNNACAHYLSGTTYGHANSYMADVHFVDGQALAPTEFGEFDSNNVWQAKEFTGDHNSAGSSTAINTLEFTGNGPHAFHAIRVDGTILTGADYTNGTLGSWSSNATNPGGSFDGDITGGNLAYSNNGGAITWTSNGGLSYTSKVEIYVGQVSPFYVNVNGGGASSALTINSWNTIAESGAGVNGFHLDFSDNSSNAALGTDSSGNSNTWTVNNLSAHPGNVATYANAVTTTEGGGAFYTGTGANLFSASTLLYGGYNSSTTDSNIIWTPPGGVAVNNPKITLSYYSAVKINGTTYTPTGSGELTIPFSGTLNTLVLENTDGTGNVVRAYGLKPDGTSLVTTVSGVDCDSLVDTPTDYGTDTGLGGEVRGSYATLNPLLKGSSTTLSNGNLGVNGAGTWNCAYGGFKLPTSGKWYWEVQASGGNTHPGICLASDNHIASATTYPSHLLNFWGVYAADGNKYRGPGNVSIGYGSPITSGDIVGLAFDADAGTLTFYINGVSQGLAFTDLYDEYIPVFGVFDAGVQTVNFGQRAWAYAAPSNYKALCTTNLPEATIKDGSKHFDVVTYEGNSSTNVISGLGFSPDLVWIKDRDGGYHHGLFDTVRGANKLLASSQTNGEVTYTQSLTSFTSDGFYLGDNTDGNNTVNMAGSSYVAWAWNAGDTTETIAAGDLTSSLYDQSQTWSNNAVTTGNGGNWSNVTNLFNGDLSNYAHANPNASDVEVTITFSPALEVSNTVTLYGVIGGAASSATWNVNNEATTALYNDLSHPPSLPIPASSTSFSGSLSSITIERTSASAAGLYLYGIKVDGKLLVDPGVSVAAVPSINSVVRANPAAGFSIVTWDASANATVAHGLNATPQLVITKSSNQATAWRIWSAEFSDADSNYLGFDASAVSTFGGAYWGSMTSTTIGLSSASYDNNYGEMLAYCFAPVEGYSAMGSFIGNGSSTDGPFINTGFEPAFLLIKHTGGDDWYIYDNERPSTKPLFPNGSYAEQPDNREVEFLSNGFKVRYNQFFNASGAEMIYMAFAKNPLNTTPEADGTGDTQVALDALVAAATEIVETDGTTMYLNGATGPWRTGLSIEGSQINAAPPGPSEITFTSQNQGTPVFSGVDATLASRTWTLESSTTATGPWTQVDTYNDFGVLSTQTGATPWTENKPTLQPNTFYRIKVAYNSTNATSVESVYNTFKTGDA